MSRIIDKVYEDGSYEYEWEGSKVVHESTEFLALNEDQAKSSSTIFCLSDSNAESVNKYGHKFKYYAYKRYSRRSDSYIGYFIVSNNLQKMLKFIRKECDWLYESGVTVGQMDDNEVTDIKFFQGIHRSNIRERDYQKGYREITFLGREKT